MKSSIFQSWMNVPLGLLSGVVMSFAVTEAMAEGPERDSMDARPNVVIILVDDAGLMDFQPFGGEAKMPAIQTLADQGVRFNNYRTSPLCAPSRAMLLTGIDNHRTGIATIPEVIPAEHRNARGYSLALEPGVKTIADRLQDAGYRTYMTGKWHMGSRSIEELPVSHGFDRSFILDASGADNWEQKPYLAFDPIARWFEDDQPATLPENFYSSEFIVDTMIDYLAEGNPDRQSGRQPFFAYLAFQAIHIPIQAPPEFTNNYEGVYDSGWHALREARWRKAQLLGIIPKGAPLAEMHEGHRNWETLSDDDRRYYTKAMMVNAGMLEAMDHHIGRLISWLASQGELENTLFVVTSDNGPEHNDIINSPGMGLWYPISGYNKDVETMGEKGSLVSIGPEWASAAASPSKLFKFYSSDGGIRVPLIIAGAGITQTDIHSSFALVTDIVPTVLELLGVAEQNENDEIAITGRSLLPVIRKDTDFTYGPDDAVGIEVSGNSALFKGRYKLSRDMAPHGDGAWRLFDIQNDPGETQDLAADKPELLAELMDDYRKYARHYGVQEIPQGYDTLKQITTYSAHVLVKTYRVQLLFACAALLLVLAFFVWRIHIKRRNRR
jgi:arylsulfatase A-like enzyme